MKDEEANSLSYNADKMQAVGRSVGSYAVRWRVLAELLFSLSPCGRWVVVWLNPLFHFMDDLYL